MAKRDRTVVQPLLLCLAMAMPALPAAAGEALPAVPPGFEAVFTGALVSTYPDRRRSKVWMAADGSFIGQGRRGERDYGSWRVEGRRVCMRQMRPIPIPLRYCTTLPGDLSRPWPATAATGEPITVAFVAGDRP